MYSPKAISKPSRRWKSNYCAWGRRTWPSCSPDCQPTASVCKPDAEPPTEKFNSIWVAVAGGHFSVQQGTTTTTQIALTGPNMSDSSPALRVLRSVFGYEQFRGAQSAIIAEVVAGRHALVLMPTGGGKSLCYQIPAILRPGVGIVVSPLIALMQDQVDALREAGVRAGFINSSLTPAEYGATLTALQSGQ